MRLPVISQSADPGAAAGAGRIWHDTDTDEVWMRDAANTGWIQLDGGGGGTPDAHAASHESGGSDEIDVTGLTGAGGGGGGLTLLDEQVASASATLDFAGMITSTYDEYMFELLDILPATNGVDLRIRLSNSGVFDAGANYATAGHGIGIGGAALFGTAGNDHFPCSNASDFGSSAGDGVSGSIRLYSPLSTATHKRLTAHLVWSEHTGHNSKMSIAGHLYKSMTAVDGLRLLFGSGNIASGIARMYGVEK